MSKNCSVARPVTPTVISRKDGSCFCNMSTLVILILIILVFSKKECGERDGSKLEDKGILFIIALFFLSCHNPCITDDPPFRNRFDFDRFRGFDFDIFRIFRGFDFDFDRDRDRFRFR